MANLLILACGEGKRNSMFTFNNAMPKCLTSTGAKTILESIIDSYANLQIDKVFVACLTKHANQIADVLKFKGYDDKVQLVQIEPTQSATASLITSLQVLKMTTAILDNDWYINWSDCYAKMPKIMPRTNTIFVDNDYCHRNIAFETDNELVVMSTKNLAGNVPGIFFVTGEVLDAVSDMQTYDIDFDKILAKQHQVCTLTKLSKVYDFGDYNKFTKNLRKYYNEHASRYFNEIKIDGSTVKKRPIDKHGEQLHFIELKYYKTYGDKVPALAKLLNYDRSKMTMTLERINGNTCQSVLDACLTQTEKQHKADKLLVAFNEAIQQIHDLQAPEIKLADANFAIDTEFIKAVDTRVQPVMSLINAVIEQNDIKSIDGMPITRSYDRLMFEITKFVHTADWHVGITHGDPNTDNSMIDKQGNIRFIDPRGYFGNFNHIGLGVIEYDIAKFVYGMTGYSRFNRAPFIVTNVEDNDVKTYIGIVESQGIADVDLFKLDINDDIRALVGIIWIKLSSYIINDPERSVLAYLYGNAILTKVLDIK